MEAAPRTRISQKAHPISVSRSPLTARIAALFAALALVGGCASTDEAQPVDSAAPPRPAIDERFQAVSQSSRVGFVVLHYTATHTDRALDILTNQNVSSHYLITDDTPPRIYQLVDEERQAWHAGESEWYGRTYLNASSIGIEIVNNGPLTPDTWQPYSDAQIDALIALLQNIVWRHQIQARNVVGHSDIAPQRKQDPGLVPMEAARGCGWSRWYDEDEARSRRQHYLAVGLPPVSEIQAKLRHAGYPVPDTGILDARTRKVIRAVQMHYRPSRYDGLPMPKPWRFLTPYRSRAFKPETAA